MLNHAAPAAAGDSALLAVSVREACRMTSLSRSKLYALMAADALPFVKLGKRRLIEVAALRALLHQFTRGAP